MQGSEVKNSYGQVLIPLMLGLRRGTTVTAKMKGYDDASWEFEASGDTLPPHVFVMTRPVAPERPVVHERPIPTAAFVAGGVSAALLLTGATSIRSQEHNDL